VGASSVAPDCRIRILQHGVAKLSRGPEAFAVILHAVGVAAPHFMAWISILTELFGGLAILMGAFVTLASATDGDPVVGGDFHCASAQRIQFDQAHRCNCCWPGSVGYEVNLLYLACLAGWFSGARAPSPLMHFFKMEKQGWNRGAVSRASAQLSLKCRMT
jgi:putative oxidoreductase